MFMTTSMTGSSRPRGEGELGRAYPGSGSTEPPSRTRWKMKGMLSLSSEAIQALPVDERGPAVLQDLVDTKQSNEHSYLVEYRGQPYAGAIAEATAWLRGRGFIARTPGQSSGDAIFVTTGG